MNTPSKKRLSARLPGMQRIWLLLKLNRPRLAMELAQVRLASQPTDLGARLALVDALLLDRQAMRALDQAKTAVGQAPENADSHFALARVHGQLGNLHTAAQGMREVLRLNPYEADFFAFQAQVQFLIQAYANAVAAAESGLSLHPRHGECLLWLMRAAEQQGHLPIADAARERLLAVAPNSGPVHRAIGQLLLRRGEATLAATHLAQALALEPPQAASLVPLLRQARRWESWPPELLRLGDYGRAPYLAGWSAVPSFFVRVVCTPVAWYYMAVANAKTKQDPLFQREPSPPAPAIGTKEDLDVLASAATASPGKWLAFVGFIGLLGWISVAWKLPPAGVAIIAFFLGRSLLRQHR
ncbi:hypothetical protein MUN81_18470 [Hymenobacter sp. 5317J-9]|uniref:hypothetical protein n=1 Tax=Hymenobacter sp. 5317J-9 TaxID=2932250 RepID=UPI001FD69756|nr:hypothetical protein [Hymenobacter sp. 5317J-9]UOQ97210.1 hypothetical protein MUN81_18470 [Hymenobacter sp. 5317J-9]